MATTTLKKETCPKCHGSGEVTYSRGNHFSIYRMGVCGKCLGSGEVEKAQPANYVCQNCKIDYGNNLDYMLHSTTGNCYPSND